MRVVPPCQGMLSAPRISRQVPLRPRQQKHLEAPAGTKPFGSTSNRNMPMAGVPDAMRRHAELSKQSTCSPSAQAQ